MPTKNNFIDHLHERFPKLQDSALGPLVSENLISPFEVTLPKMILEQIRQAIADFEVVRSSLAYQKNYEADLQRLAICNPGNRAMSNSFDFHVDSNNQIKLIEMNTNAAFLALGTELYECRYGKNLASEFNHDSFKEMVLEEIRLQTEAAGKTWDSTKAMKIAIIDEEPTQQRLFVEFLVYKELFESFGWGVTISDFRSINPSDYDFIYNRYTDFFLNRPDSAALKSAWVSGETCLSPNPFEYFLLADKERMTEWAQAGFLTSLGLSPELEDRIRKFVPECQTLTNENKEALWSDKKKWFFKPLRAFGSKQSYRGGSISRKFFDALEVGETLAQEFVPAPEQSFETPEGLQSFKYDLRCYAYKGDLQLVIARLYQGQVTNLRTPHGGFACVQFV